MVNDWKNEEFYIDGTKELPSSIYIDTVALTTADLAWTVWSPQAHPLLVRETRNNK